MSPGTVILDVQRIWAMKIIIGENQSLDVISRDTKLKKYNSISGF